MSCIPVDESLAHRRLRRSGVGAGTSGVAAAESGHALTTTGLLFGHPSSRNYDPREHIAEHPDTPERIAAIDVALAAVDWLGWERRGAPMATRAELEAVHDARLIDMLERAVACGGGPIDADTHVDAATYRAARHACGAACAMARALMAGEAPIAFAALRPAGHHAERSRAMGFCLFNNVALAAQLAIDQLGVRRVFILDWDVHHGNGTAEIFRRRDDVLFASIHQANTFPNSGPLRDAGSGAGLGYTINLPVPAGSDGELWLSLLEHVVMPAAASFGPELVLISAGFDAHRADPIGGCLLESADFARLARQVRDLARHADAPVGVVLEGGYDPLALAESVIATLRALGGDDAAESIAPDRIYTRQAASYVGHHWDL
ncbi:MAG: histone deacetylase [Solirubrobacteraceae bacterium]